jgi:Tol biopolymer transport system component
MRRLFLIAVFYFMMLSPTVALAQPIERIETRSDDPGVSLSADGRYVAFASDAGNLVSGDTNDDYDAFVYDRQTGALEMVSVASDGTQADAGVSSPVLSADGRYVAFASGATNLVTGDANGWADVFVHDRQTGVTERVSVANDGSEADFLSLDFSLSGDGRYVAFASGATNLVAGDLNDHWDVFVRDRLAGTTEIASLAADGSQGNDGSYSGCNLSSDGRYVAFLSAADNLVPGDTTSTWDVFVRDRQRATTECVGLAPAGDDVDPGCKISADGLHVAYSRAGALYVFDRASSVTTRADVAAGGAGANSASEWYSLSADGRYVAFTSWGDNLVSGDTNEAADVFVRDRAAGTTERVSLSAAGAQGDSICEGAALSADGRVVGFISLSSNLVAGDTNSLADVFVATRLFVSLRGTDRFDTAIKISKAMYPGRLPAGCGLVLAPGETFPEALCGAPLASAYGGPVLLTPAAALSAAVRSEILRLKPKYVTCIGLSGAVAGAVRAALGPTAIVNTIRGTLGSVYDMSYRVAKALKDKLGDLSGAVAIVTRGDLFPDALAVAPLACAQKWPILLTVGSGGSLNPSAAAALRELHITSAIKVGTYVSLPAGVNGLANLSGANRYFTSRNVAAWGGANAGLAFTHTALATGDKFPDALAAGPYLAADRGILLLSPLLGPLPEPTRALIAAQRSAIKRFSFIAMVEPVVGQAKALLP